MTDAGNGGGREAEVLFHAPVAVSEWERGLADYFDLSTDGGWLGLQHRYEEGRSTHTHNLRPWRRCLRVAKSVDAVCAVVERRYICYDYQSEFAAFYAHIHAGIPSTAHRVHFFGMAVGETDFRHLTPKQKRSYLGYIVCRPRDLEIVGRTVLKPPPASPVQAAVEDHVTFFGQNLHVHGVPFMQQDERIGVCGNIVAWTAHYIAYRRDHFNRRLIAEFLNRGLDFFRPKAAIGMQPLELLGLLDSVGFRTDFLTREPDDLLPITLYPWETPSADPIPDDPKALHSVYMGAQFPPSLQALNRKEDRRSHLAEIRRRLVEECSRNLNSGVPVIACSLNHAVVVCGYELVAGDSLARFTVHDDQVGPYIAVSDCLFDRYDLRASQSPEIGRDAPTAEELCSTLSDSKSVDPADLEWFEWLELLVPLPPKVFLPLYRAEQAALRLLHRHFVSSDTLKAQTQRVPPELEPLLRARATNTLRFRSYLISANDFKRRIEERGACRALAEGYHSLRLSEYVAVVEFIDSRESPRECLGEVLFDATSNPKNPWVHALRLGTSVVLVHSDGTDHTVGTSTTSLYAGARCFQSVEGVFLAKQVTNSDSDEE